MLQYVLDAFGKGQDVTARDSLHSSIRDEPRAYVHDAFLQQQ